MGPSAYDELGCANRVRNRHDLKRALLARHVEAPSGALSYGLMMSRRGFRNDFVSTRDRDLVIPPLRDSTTVVLKMSHWVSVKSMNRLLTNR